MGPQKKYIPKQGQENIDQTFQPVNFQQTMGDNLVLTISYNPMWKKKERFRIANNHALSSV